MKNTNTIVIEGINKIIEGLTDVKGALMMQGFEAPVTTLKVEPVVEEVKELLETTPTVANNEPVKEEVSPSVEEEVVEDELQEPEQEEKEEEITRYDELMGLKINEIRPIAKAYGLPAGGSKQSLVESIIEHETSLNEETQALTEAKEETKEEAPVEDTTEDEVPVDESEEDVEEDSEEEELDFTEEDIKEYKDYLDSEFEVAELKEIAKMMEVTVAPKTSKKNIIELLISDMPSLYEALDEMGCFQDSDEEDEEDAEDIEEPTVDDAEDEEEDEEDEDDSVDLIEELGLRDMTQEELADILAEHGLSTKGMKTALMDRIVLAVKNGLIEVEDDAPKQLTDKEKDILKEKIVEIETTAFVNGDLTPKDLQSFLKKYYVEEKEYHNYKKMGLSNKEALGLYISAQQSLLDDYGTRRELHDAYLKDGHFHCCGRKLSKGVDGSDFCTNCGSSYEVK